MVERYKCNIDTIFTETIQSDLLTKQFAVIGCGGQGGYILEFLARLGVKSLYFWDGDSFEESNLNRQINCNLNTIGGNKAVAAHSRLLSINPFIHYYARNWYCGERDSDLTDLLNCDFIFMAADESGNPSLMRNIVKVAIQEGIPCLDEGIQGLGGFVSIITKDEINLWDNNTHLWEMQAVMPLETRAIFGSQTAYKCAILAAESINQMVKYFSHNKYCALNSKLEIDLYHNKYREIDKYGIV